MSLNKKDIKIEYTKGQGPGGQHKNKTSSCVKVTYIPTGVSVTIDGRHQSKNKKQALRELESRINQQEVDKKADIKKAHRNKKIHDKTIIRTYDYSRGVVKDHRSGKTASLKDIIEKGKLDLLR